MNKSSIYIVKQLKPILFQVPELVTDLHSKKHSSIRSLCLWLENLEKNLKQLNYSECAKIAGLRAQLVQRKFLLDVKVNERKKRQLEKALEIIYPAQETVSNIILPLEEKIDQSRTIMKQILHVAKSLQLMPSTPPSNFSLYIQSFWRIMETHEQLRNGINNIKTIIGKTDGIQLLAEEIEL